MARNRGTARRPAIKISEATGTILELLPDEIVFGENVRSQIDDGGEAFTDLVASIKREGLIQPGTVSRAEDGKYLVEIGNRRAKACIAAGIPFIATLASGESRLERQLIENIQREDLSPADKEKSIKALVEKCGSQADAARLLGKSKQWVSDAITAEKVRTSGQKYPQNAPTSAILAIKDVPKEKLDSVIHDAEVSGGTVKAYREEVKKVRRKPIEKSVDSQAFALVTSLESINSKLEKLVVHQDEFKEYTVTELRFAAQKILDLIGAK